ncbi:hypothetical protein [Paraburkholderia domus]|nr:hypothetical protein [Paraburkholderia domus]MBK5047335.1 hypothetical protein [Burkholderia sp. R-70006]MBK5059194.1 hypothetical protein [Burkholderia sp. R-70199]MBK5119288.1 hypothetical protein [Burkholderia sp. R-69980]MBK5163276.1 hypothetical protein [Burkholderia sp. R-70211]MCI0145354.1 hypothetical protein [Paraburkholderia sediminicola]
MKFMTAGSRQRGEGLMSGWPDMKQGPEKNKKADKKSKQKSHGMPWLS